MTIPGRVIVFGSINLDICLEVPDFPRAGETIRATARREGLGGKGANQAVAAARGGAQALFCGRVGGADRALALLREAAPDLDVTGVETDDAEPSGTAHVLLSAVGENQIVILGGANDQAVWRDDIAIRSTGICLAQLEVPLPAIEVFLRAARAAGARTVLNTAPALADAQSLFPLCDVLVMNETELASYAGEGGAPEALMSRADQIVIVTLGADGARAIWRGGEHIVAGHLVPVVDTTGAGDCFCGILCAALSQGLTAEAAAGQANIAASLQVQRKGAADAMPVLEEIMRVVAD